MFTEETKNGITYMRSDAIDVFHAFSTRFGGASTGDFASLNLGSNRGDSPEAVHENYRRFCALFGAGEDGCCTTRQVHGAAVKTVTHYDRHAFMRDNPYEADGIVTAEKNLPLFCFTADCVPVLLWDSRGLAAGAVHCGWKSSVADILKNAVSAMEDLGAKLQFIKAALGPAIGSCCFETDADVPEAIEKYLGGDTEGLWRKAPGGKFMVDLRKANARRLVQLGVPEESIDISGECTFCLHEKYWSARYTGKNGLNRGSMAAGIVLEGE